MESKLLAKVTNDKLTALSISSMLINITMTLRRSITPSTQIIKRSAHYNKICSMGIIKRFTEYVVLQSQPPKLLQLAGE